MKINYNFLRVFFGGWGGGAFGLTLVLYNSPAVIYMLICYLIFCHHSAVSLSEILHKDKKLRNKLEKVFWPSKQKGTLKVKQTFHLKVILCTLNLL